MFKLFKRKNEIKELKCRVAVLESQITALNSKKEKVTDLGKSWGDEFILKGYTFENAKFHCKNCNKESSTIEAKISDLEATPANIDDLKVDKTDIPHIDKIKVGAINLEKNSSFSTPTYWGTYWGDVEPIKLGTISPVANEISFKLSSLEGDETIITFNKDGMTMSCNKKGLNVKGKTCIEVGELTDEMAKRFNLGKYARR